MADDMGLGKTYQMVAYLKLNKVKNILPSADKLCKVNQAEYKPDLIVCPLSLLRQWREEIRKLYAEFELPGKKKAETILFHGKDREENLFNGAYDYVIVTYGSVCETLAKVNWGRIVLDEAHAIKNGLAKKPPVSALKLYELSSRAEYCWCVTGTPFNNRMTDLASLARFIGTEPYSNLSWWQRASAGDIERWRAAFILRRTKEKLIEPPVYHEYQIEPTEKEKANTDALKQATKRKFMAWRQAKGEAKRTLQGEILALITKLRMYSNSYLCDKKFVSADHAIRNCAKVSKTIDLLEEAIEDDPVKGAVVFSQFTKYLSLLEKVIEETLDVAIFRFDGSMNEKRREEVVAQFIGSDRPRVLLISLMAGGVGLNLKPCATIFISEPWYNPFVEKQAEERVHRLGQDRQVNVHKFLVNNSVETWITALKEKKLAQAQDLSLLNKWDMKAEYKFVDLCELFNQHVNIDGKSKPQPAASKVKRPRVITVAPSAPKVRVIYSPEESYI